MSQNICAVSHQNACPAGISPTGSGTKLTWCCRCNSPFKLLQFMLRQHCLSVLHMNGTVIDLALTSEPYWSTNYILGDSLHCVNQWDWAQPDRHSDERWHKRFVGVHLYNYIWHISIEVGDLTMILKSGNPPTNTAMRQMQPFLSNCNRKTPWKHLITRICNPKIAHFNRSFHVWSEIVPKLMWRWQNW